LKQAPSSMDGACYVLRVRPCSQAPWNPVHNAQAIARIHRMGQKKPTFTYWLLYKNTVVSPCAPNIRDC